MERNLDRRVEATSCPSPIPQDPATVWSRSWTEALADRANSWAAGADGGCGRRLRRPTGPGGPGVQPAGSLPSPGRPTRIATSPRVGAGPGQSPSLRAPRPSDGPPASLSPAEAGPSGADASSATRWCADDRLRSRGRGRRSGWLRGRPGRTRRSRGGPRSRGSRRDPGASRYRAGGGCAGGPTGAEPERGVGQAAEGDGRARSSPPGRRAPPDRRLAVAQPEAGQHGDQDELHDAQSARGDRDGGQDVGQSVGQSGGPPGTRSG